MHSLLSLSLNLGAFPDKEYIVLEESYAGEHDMVNLVEERFNQLGIDILDVTYARIGNAVVFESISTDASITVCRIAKGERDAMEELRSDYESDLEGEVLDVYRAI